MTDTNAQTENVELTVQDLNALRSIIDVASTRGTFKAEEMSAVGAVYNKLSGFLDAIAAQAEAQRAAEAEAETQGE